LGTRRTKKENLMPVAATQLKRQLQQVGISPKKGLGQHFLVDSEVLQDILSTAQPNEQDIIIEVGPGLGVLTKELAARAGWVIGIEVDKRLISPLEQTLTSYTNVTILNTDILQTDIPALLTHASLSNQRYTMVAALPYNIASPVLRHFLEASIQPASMVVMLQREVADTIAAPPGKMSLLSVAVQLYGKATVIRYVTPQSFYPPPKIDSAILKIDVYDQPAVEVPDITRFFTIVRAGFSAPRKQLRNSLAQGLHLATAEAAVLLEQAQIDPSRRAESLALSEWAELTNIIIRQTGISVQQSALSKTRRNRDLLDSEAER